MKQSGFRILKCLNSVEKLMGKSKLALEAYPICSHTKIILCHNDEPSDRDLGGQRAMKRQGKKSSEPGEAKEEDQNMEIIKDKDRKGGALLWRSKMRQS